LYFSLWYMIIRDSYTQLKSLNRRGAKDISSTRLGRRWNLWNP